MMIKVACGTRIGGLDVQKSYQQEFEFDFWRSPNLCTPHISRPMAAADRGSGVSSVRSILEKHLSVLSNSGAHHILFAFLIFLIVPHCIGAQETFIVKETTKHFTCVLGTESWWNM